jgi:hypothetical protein
MEPHRGASLSITQASVELKPARSISWVPSPEVLCNRQRNVETNTKHCCAVRGIAVTSAFPKFGCRPIAALDGVDRAKQIDTVAEKPFDRFLFSTYCGATQRLSLVIISRVQIRPFVQQQLCSSSMAVSCRFVRRTVAIGSVSRRRTICKQSFDCFATRPIQNCLTQVSFVVI